jgi:predicted metal-dependent enzyme (double-stranded beta helix superfamily)
MTNAADAALDTLRERLDEAVRGGGVQAIAEQVKAVLQDSLACRGIPLAPRFYEARPDTYARRLLHRDPAGRYTAVVMTWGPGQKTALHDHAGIWCVECVVDGRMEIRQFDLVSEAGGEYRFEPRTAITAERGAAGCLIPPFEYHTLGNLRADGPSVTLHVYGGEMDHCHVYEPAGAGAWRRVRRDLAYHE